MRILFLSNFYPPHWIGGYELGCQSVVEALVRRGHECHVLTSSYKANTASDTASTYPVSRTLTHTFQQSRAAKRFSGISAFARDVRNRRIIRQQIAALDPDVVFLWNPMFLTPGVPIEVEQSGIPHLYFVSDQWPKLWSGSVNPDWQKITSLSRHRLALSLLNVVLQPGQTNNGLSAPRLKHALFASDFLMQASPRDSARDYDWRVTHWGVDQTNFRNIRSWDRAPRTVLYSGQFGRHKGLHTLIAAFGLLAKNGRADGVTLSVAGNAVSQEDHAAIVALIREHGLQDTVKLLGRLSREDLIHSLSNHEIFVFPSEWEEPFSISLVEAFAAGLAVVSTITGGSAELIKNGENALSFRAGDADDCADKIAMLLNSPSLCSRLSSQARQDAQSLTLIGMVDSIESRLLALAGISSAL